MKYLISGYYGEGNSGDEAILAGILQEIKRRDPLALFTVLSFNPTDTLLRHGRLATVEAVSTSLRSPWRIIGAMRDANLLISGGGSFLHEADFELYGRSFLFREGKLRPIPYFLSIICLAKSVGLPVMWYAQGLGPLHTRCARVFIARVASISDIVTWRDRASADLAYDIGVHAPVQLVVPDPAYALVPEPRAQAVGVLEQAGLGDKEPFIACCPRPWLGRSGYLEALAEVLGSVAKERDLKIALIPFHEVQDVPVCTFLAQHPALKDHAAYIEPVPSATLLAGVLREAQMVIAMRLHAGILATCACRPVVIIDYDPKTRAFAQQTHQTDWVVSVDELEHETKSGKASGKARLTAAILDTLDSIELRTQRLTGISAALRAEAQKTASLAVQLAMRSAKS